MTRLDAVFLPATPFYPYYYTRKFSKSKVFFENLWIFGKIYTSYLTEMGIRIPERGHGFGFPLQAGY